MNPCLAYAKPETDQTEQEETVKIEQLDQYIENIENFLDESPITEQLTVKEILKIESEPLTLAELTKNEKYANEGRIIEYKICPSNEKQRKMSHTCERDNTLIIGDRLIDTQKEVTRLYIDHLEKALSQKPMTKTEMIEYITTSLINPISGQIEKLSKTPKRQRHLRRNNLEQYKIAESIINLPQDEILNNALKRMIRSGAIVMTYGIDPSEEAKYSFTEETYSLKKPFRRDKSDEIYDMCCIGFEDIIEDNPDEKAKYIGFDIYSSILGTLYKKSRKIEEIQKILDNNDLNNPVQILENMGLIEIKSNYIRSTHEGKQTYHKSVINALTELKDFDAKAYDRMAKTAHEYGIIANTK